MELDGRAVGARRLEETGDLRVGEPRRVAETVDLVDEALRHGRGQDGPAQVVDVVVGPAAVLGGDAVSPEERGDDPHGQPPADLAPDPEAPELRVEVEARAGLALER